MSGGGGSSSAARAVPSVPQETRPTGEAAREQSAAEVETARRRAVVLAQEGTGRGATLLGSGVTQNGRLRSTLG